MLFRNGYMLVVLVFIELCPPSHHRPLPLRQTKIALHLTLQRVHHSALCLAWLEARVLRWVALDSSRSVKRLSVSIFLK
jgi:hypothetical protein